jgi:peptide deformylase
MIQAIVKAGDPRLKLISNPISNIEDKEDLKKLFQDMKDTVNASHSGVRAVGLAAVQIGVLKRVIIINYGPYKNLIMANPVMVEGTGRMKHDEMCLSFPGCFKRKTRKQYIKVEYLDEHLNQKSQVFTAMEAFIVQHELDHLDGKTLDD